MKKIALTIVALLISSVSFAYSSSQSNHSPMLKALGSAWKAQQSLNAQSLNNDIAIVYGGEDISRYPLSQQMALS